MALNRKAVVLLVEDDAPQRKTLKGFLEKRGYDVAEADSAANAKKLAEQREVDLLLTDLRLGGPDGIDLLNDLRDSLPDLQAIVLTAYGSVNDAVRAMRAGAYDFVGKPVDLDRLEALVAKALEKVELSRENRELREVVKNQGAFNGVIGQSVAMQKVVTLAARVAPSKASVLILGESGTGKEVLARAVHLASPRKNKPFVVVNCAALPETLIESELFGYEKGAFTGASSLKRGRFELADGGTLFLDEVGEIPPGVQVKLLGVLQSGRFERLGGTETIGVDVRVIAATNRDIAGQVARGGFREDLFYRLNVVTITLPPLRERKGDVPLLARHFLTKHADLSGRPAMSVGPDVMQALDSYPFPGNVRELENWIERAVALSDGEQLDKDDLPEQLSGSAPSDSCDAAPGDQGLDDQLDALEVTLIRQTLEKNSGNQSAAARDLKISERAMRYKMRKHGL